jgi:aspartate racemase
VKKTIGILGGMGPEATAYFFSLIIKHTQAGKDQDHIPIIIYNNPKIPPRTDALLHEGPSPLPLLRQGIRLLERAGADFTVIPCITAHAFFSQLAAKEKIHLLDILEETLAYVRKKIPGLGRAGLIASTGSVKSEIFDRTFSRAGIKIIKPSAGEQEKIMEAIFGKKGIKAGFISGRPKNLILEAAQRLIRSGAEAVIAGCTEVPLVLQEKDLSVPLIEPLRIAAEASIIRAGYKVKD